MAPIMISDDKRFTPYTEDDIVQILFGKREDHPLLFFSNPSVKEPILTTFGKLQPWRALENRNVPVQSWMSLFNYALAHKPFSFEQICIPRELKLFLAFNQSALQNMNHWIARIRILSQFTEDSWKHYVMNAPETDPNPPVHTHPDILWACNHLEEYVRTVSFGKQHIFYAARLEALTEAI